ncbi:protein kinase [Phytophthora infestans T30-4]|uniref:Protein kinase n=1 Tax=Phytophthora infestans (strain T30-4) TaxID=403677 RepID=D0MY27_PHYIT|nr:protein kinase [Phytophthora infestans T30-4]EEY66075.1 protein kinase [Phytophthora infestans T30-4]|eukprot:XP_002906674.1 protein kinase [Phytophthora infestans T30-4]
MRATEVVHPVNGTTMTAPSLKNIFVLYSLMGEELEPVQESKPQRGPDTNWNAFVLPLPSAGGRVRLADVQKAFPLGSNYHFAFRCEDGAYLDLTNPDSAVPFCGRKILARITPLDEEISVEYLHYEESREAFALIAMEVARQNVVIATIMRSSSRRRTSPKMKNHQHQLHARNHVIKCGRIRREMNGTAITTRTAALNTRTWVMTIAARSLVVMIDMTRVALVNHQNGLRQAKTHRLICGNKRSKHTILPRRFLLRMPRKVRQRQPRRRRNGSETIQVGGVTVQVVRLLAEGAYAQVLLVRSSATNETFALKRILCQSQEVENDVQMELQVFRSVKHLNIMPLVEFSEARVQQGMEFYFLVPYFERGSLWDAIDAACQSSSPLWPFTQRTALHLFHGICAGVLALHRAGFCHRDIKPHNILLSSSSTGEDFLAYIPVVTDFGSCAPIRVEVNSRRNSLELQDEANRKSSAPYRAPELFEPTVDVALDGQSDVWSLGCVLYTMAFGTSPFEHPREGFMKLACLNGRVSFPPEQGGVVLHRGTQFTIEFCDFIRDMLHTNPEERPSVLDALEFTEELLNDEMQR